MENLKDRVTIYEVAKASGVSLATVSRVINNRGNVTEETRNRVNSVIERLKYKPSNVAQSLARNRSTNIGVVIPSANYVYISNFLNGITEVAKEKGFTLTMFVTSRNRDDALRMVEQVITSHVDGAIVFDDQLDEKDIDKINSYNVPIVVINNEITGDKIGSIQFGYDTKLSEVLKNTFIKGNSKTPTFIHVHNTGKLLADLENVFVSVCTESNVDYRIFTIDDSYTRTYSDFKEFFKTHKSGYFVAVRDSIAAAIENAASDSGLRIPEDVEVISIIGTKYAKIMRPRISSLSIDMLEVGKRAMYLLTEMANQNLEKKTYRFEAVYEKRDSTED